MWAVLPRLRLPTRACRHFAATSRSSPATSASESPFGLLQAIQGTEVGAGDGSAPSGHILSVAGGLARVAMTGPVSVGASVDLGEGIRGVVLQFDKKGTIVAPLSRQQPRSATLATMEGPLCVKAPSSSAEESGSITFASVSEILDCQDSATSTTELLRLPPMPNPTRRRPVKRWLPSGLAAVEALLPLGEGHRVGLVGPAGTGKSTAVRMLLASQPEDVVCVYAAARPRLQLEKELKDVKIPVTCLHADPVYDTLASRYLLPICALQLATQLRKSHSHVLLVLDDLVSFAAAAAELNLGYGGKSRGLLPLSVPQVLGSALYGGGTEVNQGGQEQSLSVVTVLDLNPDDDLPPVMRGLWSGVEPSLDVCVRFSAKLAMNGIMPAIDPKELLPCGHAPSFQVPLLQLLRSELCKKLREGYDLSYRMELAKDLKMQMEDDEHEDLASSTNLKALLGHSSPRPLPELAVLLCAALVYRLTARRTRPHEIARFQQAVIEAVRTHHPALWNTLESMEALNQAEAQAVLRNLGGALMEHRFDFELTRPEL